MNSPNEDFAKIGFSATKQILLFCNSKKILLFTGTVKGMHLKFVTLPIQKTGRKH
jgi:hypothetical protein